jgi:hypothetical protein
MVSYKHEVLQAGAKLLEIIIYPQFKGLKDAWSPQGSGISILLASLEYWAATRAIAIKTWQQSDVCGYIYDGIDTMDGVPPQLLDAAAAFADATGGIPAVWEHEEIKKSVFDDFSGGCELQEVYDGFSSTYKRASKSCLRRRTSKSCTKSCTSNRRPQRTAPWRTASAASPIWCAPIATSSTTPWA